MTIDQQQSPTIAEIADYLGESEEAVLEAMEMGQSYHALSMDYKLNADSEGGTVTLFDLVGEQEDGYEKADQRLLVEEALHVLTEQERKVIHFTFMEQMSQKEAGEQIGISQMHVSRLQRRAIKKLKEAILVAGGADEWSK